VLLTLVAPEQLAIAGSRCDATNANVTAPYDGAALYDDPSPTRSPGSSPGSSPECEGCIYEAEHVHSQALSPGCAEYGHRGGPPAHHGRRGCNHWDHPSTAPGYGRIAKIGGKIIAVRGPPSDGAGQSSNDSDHPSTPLGSHSDDSEDYSDSEEPLTEATIADIHSLAEGIVANRNWRVCPLTKLIKCISCKEVRRQHAKVVPCVDEFCQRNKGAQATQVCRGYHPKEPSMRSFLDHVKSQAKPCPMHNIMKTVLAEKLEGAKTMMEDSLKAQRKLKRKHQAFE
jgi:hypothetical protein